RCALDLSEEFPLAKVALGVGRAVVTARRPRGEVIDEVIALLATAEAGRVRVDERAASALATHFRVVFGPRPFLAGNARGGGRPRTVLGTDTPCFGRERELGTLLGLWEECKNESVARTVLVTAPAGGGKTRVRLEFLDRLGRNGGPFVLIVG